MTYKGNMDDAYIDSNSCNVYSYKNLGFGITCRICCNIGCDGRKLTTYDKAKLLSQEYHGIKR